MRQLLSILATVAIGAGYMTAQTIKPMTATVDDYLPLLESAGYMTFPFDLSALSDKRYTITVNIREYENGEIKSANALPWEPTYSNMQLISDFDKEQQALIAREVMADPDRGIYSLAEKINIGFHPIADSLQTVFLDIQNMGSMSYKLKLKAVRNPSNDTEQYLYGYRPFRMPDTITAGEFIPLVLAGSFWFDKDFNVIRFCGENTIEPDLSSNIVSSIPHYYVVGIKITPADSDNKQI